MYEYIKGRITDISPTHAVIDISGVGYLIQITLNCYTHISAKTDVQLYIHQVIREDAQLLFGFYDKAERDMFRLLISVSGIGANTARMMLSSLTQADLAKAIMEGNVNLLKSIKGIGLKTAQRIIVDLKDKVGKSASIDITGIPGLNTQVRGEAVSALVMLGFSRQPTEKVIDSLLAQNNNLTVEELIKLSLKHL